MRESRESKFCQPSSEPPTFVYLYTDHHDHHHELNHSFPRTHIAILSLRGAGFRSLRFLQNDVRESVIILPDWWLRLGIDCAQYIFQVDY